jgi:hypothetical protein
MVLHIGRTSQSIVYRDKDIICLTPMTADEEISSMEIQESGTDFLLYTTDGVLEKSNRFLAYSRVTPTGTLQNGYHACFWAEEGAINANFFREVISPRVSYDNDSNSISLMFWTNFTESVTTYDPDKLWIIDEHKYDPTTEVYPALCVAIGSIQKLKITGGFIPDSGASASSLDVVPWFGKPKILDLYPQTIGTDPEAPAVAQKTNPAFDFSPEIVLYKAVANEVDGTIDVKTCDSNGDVDPDDDVITLNTIP